MVFDDELKSYIKDNQRKTEYSLKKIKNLSNRGEYYKIKKYLDDFLEEDNSVKRFVVMPGLRGVGKTTILLQLYDYLINKKDIDNKDILLLSMDEVVNYFNTNLLAVVDNFLTNIHNTTKTYLDKKIFLFVDESHFDKKWAVSGKIIYDNSQNIFLLCTGSSAIDLEINADIARRSFKEYIYPNNFGDYVYLKHKIKTNYSFSKSLENQRFSNVGKNGVFSKTLENIIYFGEEKYINEGIRLEEEIQDKLYSLKNYPKSEFNQFLKSYGFPFALELDEEDIYNQTFFLINMVIEKDIPAIKSFNTSTNVNIRRILIYLAMARSELVSTQKIADYLAMSSKTVSEILGVLEKTQIIFNIKPYGSAGKIVKKPWKYYFLSPTLKSAINYDIGRFNLDSKKCLGTLAENYVATSLFKLNQTRFHLMGLFYPPEKKGCDFLLRTKLDDMVPIEVGIGKKTKSQLTRAINKYDSKYGVLISNGYSNIQRHNNIIHIPLLSFGFL